MQRLSIPHVRPSVQNIWGNSSNSATPTKQPRVNEASHQRVQMISSPDLEWRTKEERAAIEQQIKQILQNSRSASGHGNTGNVKAAGFNILINGKMELILVSIDTYDVDDNGNILASGNDEFWGNTEEPVFDIAQLGKKISDYKEQCIRNISYNAVDPHTGYSIRCLIGRSLNPAQSEEIKTKTENYFDQHPDKQSFQFEWRSQLMTIKNWRTLLTPVESAALEKPGSYFNSKKLINSPNRHGTIVFEQSYLIKSFHEKIDELVLKNTSGDPVMIVDIGCATGPNTGSVLEKYKDKVRVVGSDLSRQALAGFRGQLSDELRSYITYSIGRFPHVCNLKENSCNVILHSHVTQYDPPEDKKLSFATMYSLLTEDQDSFLYLQALTPYSAPYTWRQGVSQLNRQRGAEWPGAFFSSWESESKFATGEEQIMKTMPTTGGYPVYPEELKRELEKVGFEVEINYGRFDYKDCPSNIKSPLTYEEHEWFITHPLEESAQDKAKVSEIDSRLLREAPALRKYILIDRFIYTRCLAERQKSIVARTPSIQKRENTPEDTRHVARSWGVEPVPGVLPILDSEEPVPELAKNLAQQLGMDLEPIPASIKKLALELEIDFSEEIRGIFTMVCVHVIAKKTRKNTALHPPVTTLTGGNMKKPDAQINKKPPLST